MPELQALADRYKDRGATLVTVVTHSNLERARAVAGRIGLTAPILLPTGRLMRTFHVDAVPWTVVIGRDGKAKEALRGGQSRSTFERAITSRL